MWPTALLVFLFACSDKAPLVTDSGLIDVDGDGDGYPDTADCDDTDAAIHPDADEVCDGLDNNCSGAVDDDPIDPMTWYDDGDSDGYGDPTTETTVCDAPSGYISDGTDCDDTDAAINPGHAEVCDGIDNDCNDATDEDEIGEVQAFYIDEDGDGYGDSSSAITACNAPSGYVDSDTDCDDTEALINPDAQEICSDGVDNNCDGSPSDCIMLGSYLSSDATQSWSGEETYDMVGEHVGDGGDLSGNGHNDALVTALTSDYSGRVYIFSGGAEGLSDAPTASISGEGLYDDLAHSVDRAGDISGDGFDDILVGSPGDGPHNSRAYGYFGPISGDLTTDDADFIVSSDEDYQYLGWQVAGLGDTNSDGHDDILITTPAGSTPMSGGEGLLFLGPVIGELAISDADAVLTGRSPGANAGWTSHSPGDFNGDGLNDISLAAPSQAVGTAYEGEVYVVFGPASGSLSLSDADLTVKGSQLGDSVGSIYGAGDTNGDGYSDLLVASPWHDDDTGAVWLMLGPVSGSRSVVDADAILNGAAKDDNAGSSVDADGDLNSDGCDDIVIGAARTNDNIGTVYGLFGPISGTIALSTDADITIDGEAYGLFGQSVAILDDVQGDGVDDLLIGAYGEDGSASLSGMIYMFYGGL